MEVSQSFNQEIPKHSNYYGRFAMHPKKKRNANCLCFVHVVQSIEHTHHTHWVQIP